jgi:hypothetical protein
MKNSMALRQRGVILETEHNLETDYHMWVLIPGWKGQPIEVRRDWLGRPNGQPWRTWLVVMCNNSECPARALIRVSSHIEEIVENALPVPPRVALGGHDDH